ncbi:unnamed protein product [Protopolystoma xenopodis]|uniref:Uncharacterized protein n=1 Tax=Protopolystoma xenopodis TaxID=117903 RepID=A0A448XSW0_9PLAT|nr:unnamed protein product [Protopolystoma xenopodis]
MKKRENAQPIDEKAEKSATSLVYNPCSLLQALRQRPIPTGLRRFIWSYALFLPGDTRKEATSGDTTVRTTAALSKGLLYTPTQRWVPVQNATHFELNMTPPAPAKRCEALCAKLLDARAPYRITQPHSSKRCVILTPDLRMYCPGRKSRPVAGKFSCRLPAGEEGSTVPFGIDTLLMGELDE